MAIYKEYVTTEKGTIKFSIWYDKNKGYWVSATPVKITERAGYSMEETGAFTGFTDTLLRVERQSSKRADEAIKVLQERKEEYLKFNFKY